MSQVLDFTNVSPTHRRARRSDESARSFAGEADPNNAPRRVLAEMLLVLTGAALAACALSWLAPALS